MCVYGLQRWARRVGYVAMNAAMLVWLFSLRGTALVAHDGTVHSDASAALWVLLALCGIAYSAVQGSSPGYVPPRWHDGPPLTEEDSDDGLLSLDGDALDDIEAVASAEAGVSEDGTLLFLLSICKGLCALCLLAEDALLIVDGTPMPNKETKRPREE